VIDLHSSRPVQLGSILMAVLSLCGLTAPPAQPTPPAHTQAPSLVMIDWVNFMQFGDIQYLASPAPGRALTSSALGPRFAQIRHTVAGAVHDPRYRPRNGDAAFLEAGTPVYLVRGYCSTFRLAVRWRGAIELFETDTNPHARRGADLLDLAGKVRAIAVTSPSAHMTRLTVIRQPQQIASLVTMILHAPVDQQRQGSPQGPTYVLTFSLTDGTRVTRSYDASAGLLERGILLPKEFTRLLQHAMPTRQ